VSRYQKGKTNLDFTEARDSEWQWHQLGYVQVRISLQTDNHASTPPLSFFKGRMPFLPPSQQRQSTEGTYHRCKKTFFDVFFILVTFFYFFIRFLLSKRFFILKKTLAKFGAASRLTRSTFKITATK